MYKAQNWSESATWSIDHLATLGELKIGGECSFGVVSMQ
jgi:hypothetical protein